MQQSNPRLSKGAIQRMLRNDTDFQPTLQVLDVKRIVTGQSGERFRLVLSDSEYYIQGMLATQCTDLVSNDTLKKWTIIKLQEFVANNISGKKICVVIQCQVVGQMQSGIGKPLNVLTLQSSSSSVSHQQSSPNRNQQNRPAPPQHQQAFHQQGYNQNMNQNMNQRQHQNQNQGQQNYFQRNANQNGRGYQSMDNIQPVSSLNPYQNSWKIKVRCTKKDTFRHYSNQKGDGKFFGVDLLDKEGTEIRAVAFNEAAEKFFPIFAKNGVYLISKGQVRLARKGYSHIKNDYSITLNADAEVVPVHDNDNEIDQQKYKFVKIEQIQQVEAKSFVDVIGVIIHVDQLGTIMSNRTQSEIKRRNIKIADQTAKIDVTLWNKDAEDFDEDKVTQNCIVALKGCKVSTYGGRSLSASGLIEYHPDRPETRELLNWLQSCGGNVANQQILELTSGNAGVSGNAPRRTFAEVKEMNLGGKISSKIDKKDADYFTVVATITTIAQNQDRKPWYEANPDPNSDAKNAKVTSMGDGRWRCEKNGKVYDSFIPRYILRFCASDFTGNIWLTAFNEVAEKILKKPATEALRLSQNDPIAYDKMFKDAQFKKYVFKCKAFSDVWEDSQRVRYDVIGVQIADPQQESEKLLEKIDFLTKLKENGNNNNMQGNNY